MPFQQRSYHKMAQAQTLQSQKYWRTCHPPRCKTELQLFLLMWINLGTINYLSKFSQSTMKVCEPLRKITSVKPGWTWNGTYQDLYDKVKMLITKDECMKFYDASKQLYLEEDASGIGLGIGLWQMQEGFNGECDEVPNSVALCPIAFARIWLSSDTTALNGKHWAYYMGSSCSTTTASQKKYSLSMTTNWW